MSQANLLQPDRMVSEAVRVAQGIMRFMPDRKKVEQVNAFFSAVNKNITMKP